MGSLVISVRVSGSGGVPGVFLSPEGEIGRNRVSGARFTSPTGRMMSISWEMLLSMAV
jgi:hypothetical protein